MYRAVIFDLDGTLLDTLDDLTDAVNHALSSVGLPCHTRDSIRLFVGNGVAKLIDRAVPSDCSEEVKAQVLALFKAYYSAHCRDKTKPYEGILPLLSELKRAGIKTAIVSNKYDGAVKALSDDYFGDLIHIAVGERESEGIRKKPAPDTLLMALRSLDICCAEDTVYVGDSDVDIQTADAAHMPCISVSWGFRDKDFLLSHGAQVIVDTPAALRGMILPEGEDDERF